MIKTKTITTVALLTLVSSGVTDVLAKTLEPKETVSTEMFYNGDCAIDRYGKQYLVRFYSNGDNVNFSLLDPETLALVKEFKVSGLTSENEGSSIVNIRNFAQRNDGDVNLLLTQTLFNTDDKWEFVFSKNDNEWVVVNEAGDNLGSISKSGLCKDYLYFVPYYNMADEWRARLVCAVRDPKNHYEDTPMGLKFFLFTNDGSNVDISHNELQTAVGYPNPVPAGSDFSISMTSEIPEGTTLNVATISGAVVYSTELKAGETKAVVPASVLTPGVYVYSVVAGDTPFASGKILAE